MAPGRCTDAGVRAMRHAEDCREVRHVPRLLACSAILAGAGEIGDAKALFVGLSWTVNEQSGSDPVSGCANDDAGKRG